MQRVLYCMTVYRDCLPSFFKVPDPAMLMKVMKIYTKLLGAKLICRIMTRLGQKCTVLNFIKLTNYTVTVQFLSDFGLLRNTVYPHMALYVVQFNLSTQNIFLSW